MTKTLLKYLAILFGMLALIEICLSYIVGYNQRPLYSEHPTIEYVLNPSQHLKRFGNNYHVNSFGMRSVELPESSPQNNTSTVLVLGDSIVNGGTKITQSDLATSILENNLNQGSETQTLVGNISAGSWGPENLLAYINEYGTFNATIAIVVLSSHDAFDIPSYHPLDPQTHPTERRTSLHEVFLKLTHTKQARSIGNEVIRKRSLIKQNLLNPALSTLLQKLSKSADTYLIIHRRESELNQNPNSNIAIIKNSCKATGVYCVDTLSTYLRVHEKESIYFDGLHLNASGQQLLSEILFSTIEKNYR